MNAQHEPEEPAFRVTLKEVFNDVQEIKRLVSERLPEDLGTRLRKVEIQIAAQWVVVGIVIVALGAIASRALTLT